MNYYFLLEDSQSFIKILPKWFEYIEFNCTRVPDISQIEKNNYVLQSGHGVTQLITRALFDTIDTIISNPGKIDHLVIVLDAESESMESRKQQVIDKINDKYNQEELDFEINIFVCNRCIETWLLGRKNLYPSYEETIDTAEYYKYFETHFRNHYNHYNIELNDPEKMLQPTDYTSPVARYHFKYFHDLCQYNNLCKKEKLKYTKSKPQIAMDKQFFKGLINRIDNTEHLLSFREFITFLRNAT
ncbi:MAG: hypothetical protein J6A58_01605 [Oscillospiraceae bacterium]|nr:hypothetical protein [Oscillospiraceae bacterium]